MFYLFIHPTQPVCQSIPPFICLSRHLYPFMSIHPYYHPSLSIQPSIHPSIHLFIYLAHHPFISLLFIHPLIHSTSIHPNSSIHLYSTSHHPSIHLSNQPTIHPSTHLSKMDEIFVPNQNLLWRLNFQMRQLRYCLEVVLLYRNHTWGVR